MKNIYKNETIKGMKHKIKIIYNKFFNQRYLLAYTQYDKARY